MLSYVIIPLEIVHFHVHIFHYARAIKSLNTTLFCTRCLTVLENELLCEQVREHFQVC